MVINLGTAGIGSGVHSPQAHVGGRSWPSAAWCAYPNPHSTTSAWFVSLFYGYVGYNGKSYAYYVWPVRGGR